MNNLEIKRFQQHVWDYYAHNRRGFPWRYVEDPYYVLVSEVMLQQTQTFRVEVKFTQFMNKFFSINALAIATWPEVLLAWQGLGYNSRAKRLHQTAQAIVAEYDGNVPASQELLIKLPGIGPYTAASICAFAYNQPTVFVETNIRAVFIHHFFPGQEKIADKEIFPFVKKTLDVDDPRSWYYALMDYGVFLKKQANNPTRRSKHYARQSKFEGSDRQIRSSILRRLLEVPLIYIEELILSIEEDPDRVRRILQQLDDEKLIKCQDGYACLS